MDEMTIGQDMARNRQEALARGLLHTLRHTIQITPLHVEHIEAAERMRADFTLDSLAVIAPLIKAVGLLEAIIWASDGCVGHRQCAHSMQPWQDARELLGDKWKAEEECRPWPYSMPATERSQ